MSNISMSNILMSDTLMLVLFEIKVGNYRQLLLIIALPRLS
jgi:hypothetical protein